MLPIIFPKAIWKPIVNHSAPGKLTDRNLIVLHITEGPTASSAIETFKASKAPHRTSAHFVIDRDGTVYQLIDIRDTAWHASQVNSHSVGIEHAASTKGLPATEEQYAASSRLVAWLCKQLGIACTRDNVKTHNEASPKDKHVLCCTGALDPDKVVKGAQDIISLGPNPDAH